MSTPLPPALDPLAFVVGIAGNLLAPYVGTNIKEAVLEFKLGRKLMENGAIAPETFKQRLQVTIDRAATMLFQLRPEYQTFATKALFADPKLLPHLRASILSWQPLDREAVQELCKEHLGADAMSRALLMQDGIQADNIVSLFISCVVLELTEEMTQGDMALSLQLTHSEGLVMRQMIGLEGRIISTIRAELNLVVDKLSAIQDKLQENRRLGEGSLPHDRPVVGAPDLLPTERDALISYLNQLFVAPWAEVTLADAGPDGLPRKLLDVYAPLPVDLTVSWEAAGDRLSEWWVGRIAERHFGEDEETRRARIAKHTQDAIEQGLSRARLKPFVDTHFQRWLNNRHSDPNHIFVDDEGKPRSHVASFMLTAHEVAPLSDAMVLLGGPGAGKSSVARHLALCLAGAYLHSLGVATSRDEAQLSPFATPRVPIYIELRDWVAQESLIPPVQNDHEPKLPDPSALRGYLSLPHKLHAGATPPEHLLNALFKLLNHGNAVLILDGLDEINRAEIWPRRRQMVRLVESLRAQGMPILVTSRIKAYRQPDNSKNRSEWHLDGFGVTELAPLRETDKHALAARAFGDDALADEFIAALRDKEVPDDLQDTPLFLTLLAGMWQDGKTRGVGDALPNTPFDLYRRSLERLLLRHERKMMRGASDAEAKSAVEAEMGLRWDDLHAVLRRIALKCCEQRQPDLPEDAPTPFSEEDLLSVIKDVTQKHRVFDIAERTLEYLQKNAGVIVSPQANAYQFAHKSFQEHLAASQLLGPNSSPTPNELVTRVMSAPGAWREVLRHACNELHEGGPAGALHKLLDLLIEPYRKNASAANATQCAAQAFENAMRLGVTRLASNYDRERTLRYFVEATTTLMTDTARATPPERAIAGDARAELGDDRFSARRWGLPVDPDFGLIHLPAGHYRLGTRQDDFPDLMKLLELGENDWDNWRDEANSDDSEIPVPAFSLARFPVTVGQWRTYVAAQRDVKPDFKVRDMDSLAGPDTSPARSVTWYEAMDYCRWLTDRLRDTEFAAVLDMRYPQGWRGILPSELEWEYAARNCRISSNIWPWGDAPDPNRANYSDSGISRRSAVGCFPNGATEQGVEDLIGNVWEWTRSNYDRPDPEDSQKRIRFDYPYNPDDDREQIDTSVDWRRTLRGGSFGLSYWFVRVAFRLWSGPSDWSDGYGFRVAVCAYSS